MLLKTGDANSTPPHSMWVRKPCVLVKELLVVLSNVSTSASYSSQSQPQSGSQSQLEDIRSRDTSVSISTSHSKPSDTLEGFFETIHGKLEQYLVPTTSHFLSRMFTTPKLLLLVYMEHSTLCSPSPLGYTSKHNAPRLFESRCGYSARGIPQDHQGL